MKKQEKISQDLITIFGTHRGGTTWIAEMMAQISDSAICYDAGGRGLLQYDGQMPAAHKGKIATLQSLGFYYFQPIPQDTVWPEAQQVFQDLFERKIINKRLYRNNSLSEIPDKKNVVFKFCSANLYLPWLVDNFQLNPILIVRHPCAVVASQLKHIAWRWIHQHAYFKLPNFKYDAFFLPHKAFLEQLNTPEEILAAIWALLTKYVVHHPYNNKKWITVSYEHLYAKPEKELTRIFNKLHLPLNNHIFKQVNVPSETSRGQSPKSIQSKKQLEKWRTDLNQMQIDRILKTVKALGVDFYDADLFPSATIHKSKH